tara:strand:- start:12 stop:236 length:225 start_codon:yes stop_codon:yes gene_type:complete
MSSSTITASSTTPALSTKTGYRFDKTTPPTHVHKKTIADLERKGRLSLKDLLDGHVYSCIWNSHNGDPEYNLGT